MRHRAICAISLPGTGGATGVFAIGADRGMYVKVRVGRDWYPSPAGWFPLGGAFESRPAAIVRRGQTGSEPAQVEVYALGIAGQPFRTTLTFPALLAGATETPWAPSLTPWLPIDGVFDSPLDAAVVDGRAMLVGRGADRQPFLGEIDRAGMLSASGWLPLTGSSLSEPVIASRTSYRSAPASQTGNPARQTGNPVRQSGNDGAAPGVFDIFCIGASAEMFRMRLDGANSPSEIPGWESVGGVFEGTPAAVTWSDDRTDVFGIGGARQMFHRVLQDGVWISGWDGVGGPCASDPAVVASGEDRIDLFCLGADGQIRHKYWARGGWAPTQTDWLPLGGAFVSAPAVVSTSTGRIELMAIGTDGQMHHKMSDDGRNWDPAGLDWMPLGGAFAIAPAREQSEAPAAAPPRIVAPAAAAQRTGPARAPRSGASEPGLKGALAGLQAWIRGKK